MLQARGLGDSGVEVFVEALDFGNDDLLRGFLLGLGRGFAPVRGPIEGLVDYRLALLVGETTRYLANLVVEHFSDISLPAGSPPFPIYFFHFIFSLVSIKNNIFSRQNS